MKRVKTTSEIDLLKYRINYICKSAVDIVAETATEEYLLTALRIILKICQCSDSDSDRNAELYEVVAINRGDNMQVKFRKKNKTVYGQDMQIKRGVPSGIEFEVEPFIKGRVKMTAIGYGDLERGYGNGKIYVDVKSLPEKIRHHFI